MVKKKYLSKLFLVGVMCMSLITPMLSSVSTYADTNSTGNVNSVGSEIGDTNESAVGKDVTQGKKTEYQDGVTGTNHTEIYMTVASQFDVVIPKTVILDGVGKVGAYSIKLDGDIPGTAKITVVPDATSTLHSEGKDDIIAEISQVQTEWVNSNLSQVATGTITANGATAGVWKGDLNFNINYDGEGGSGDAHIHNWAESITKEATCTTTGVKTFTCSCGATKTQTIPAKGHNYVDGVCSNCGAEQICSHVDDNNDHLCDKCGQVISSHVDVDKNHICDTCNEKISEHNDVNGDGQCDYCGHSHTLDTNPSTTGKHVCTSCGDVLSDCIDEDNNHMCDICSAKLSDCEDTNNDHNCDICGKKLTNHTDEDKDHVCDICGSDGIGTHTDKDNDGNCEYCGQPAEHTHSYVKLSSSWSNYGTYKIPGVNGSNVSVSDSSSSSNGLDGTVSGMYASGNSETSTCQIYSYGTVTIPRSGDFKYDLGGYVSAMTNSSSNGQWFVVIENLDGTPSYSQTINAAKQNSLGLMDKASNAPETIHLEKGKYYVQLWHKYLSGTERSRMWFRLNTDSSSKVCSGCGAVEGA